MELNTTRYFSDADDKQEGKSKLCSISKCFGSSESPVAQEPLEIVAEEPSTLCETISSVDNTPDVNYPMASRWPPTTHKPIPLPIPRPMPLQRRRGHRRNSAFTAACLQLLNSSGPLDKPKE